ncbi:hypothetical protein COEREDRAFT_12097 [Coemansia reversa NRRL 1564]|uniref:Uncharacterized protein n=1 Tax=Coemansia reversa (strain ATCC 12441 / NRRL 1564) TaxID=763665 RepID=A0A2G5B1G4_COERN|nr:hypothetical protein COEREDRAFT_12097 [Coemansia reversa NRRL 1564]|eukprot:PIA12849.1 hypothetical protein COEREDRAFT_12097 [Coemansia reversa NRRL 1564]
MLRKVHDYLEQLALKGDASHLQGCSQGDSTIPFVGRLGFAHGSCPAAIRPPQQIAIEHKGFSKL